MVRQWFEAVVPGSWSRLRCQDVWVMDHCQEEDQTPASLCIDFIDWLLPPLKTNSARRVLTWFHALRAALQERMGLLPCSCQSLTRFSIALQSGGHSSSEVSNCEVSSAFFVLTMKHAFAIDEKTACTSGLSSVNLWCQSRFLGGVVKPTSLCHNCRSRFTCCCALCWQHRTDMRERMLMWFVVTSTCLVQPLTLTLLHHWLKHVEAASLSVFALRLFSSDPWSAP